MNNYNEYEDLKEKVLIWAEDKGILSKEFAPKQFMKFIEESGELSRNILKGNDCKDDFGDVLVTLIILSEQLGYDLVDCLGAAYDEIKNRKGATVNGIFVKDSSPVEEKYSINENISIIESTKKKISNMESSIKDLEEEGKDSETIKLMRNKLNQFKNSLTNLMQEVINEFDEKLNKVIKCTYETPSEGRYIYKFKDINVVLDLKEGLSSIQYLENMGEGPTITRFLITDAETILDSFINYSTTKNNKNEK